MHASCVDLYKLMTDDIGEISRVIYVLQTIFHLFSLLFEISCLVMCCRGYEWRHLLNESKYAIIKNVMIVSRHSAWNYEYRSVSKFTDVGSDLLELHQT